ncbi:MAG: NAD-dependent epimerase/dehydratase family protein [Spirochaetota bacterium]
MKHILITGANGFLGIHLESHLYKQGYGVTSAYRESHKDFRNPLVSNAVDTNRYKRVFLHKIDSQTDWSSYLEEIDCVIHLLGKAHSFYDNELTSYLETNSKITEKLAQDCAKNETQFIFMSTALVHGNSCQSAIQETDPYRGFNSYSLSKIKAEQALQKLYNTEDLQYAILRPPMIYGSYGKGNFQRLYTLLRRGLPLPFASITNRRSFLFIGNLLDAVSHLLQRDTLANDSYLLADPEDLSTPELIRQMAKHLRQSSRLFPFPLTVLKAMLKPIGKAEEVEKLQQSFYLDTTKIRTELAWKPPYSNEAGIKSTLEFLKQET